MIEPTVFDKQEELNRRKKVLEKRMRLGMAVSAEEFLDLAREYKAIGSKGNYAGCMLQYEKLGGLSKLPKTKTDWQKRADVK